MGAYGDKIKSERTRSNMTDAQVSAAKNTRTRQRNAERRAARLEQIAARPKYTPSQQLERLDGRLDVGVGAKKERAKLAEKIVAMAT